MPNRVRHIPERFLRKIAVLLLVVATISPLAFAPVTNAQSSDPPLDLSAMTLTPWDLDDAGVSSAGHGSSVMVFIDDYAESLAGSYELDVDEVREELDDAGFIRAYTAQFYVASSQGTDVTQTVSSFILEFAGAGGAEDIWALFEDAWDSIDIERLDGFDDLGDQSGATIRDWEDPVTGDRATVHEVTVLVGQIMVGITVYDWTGDEPDLDDDTLRELIEFALDQAEDGLEADQPALSNQILRLEGDTVSTYHDAYVLRDGEAVWFYGETPDRADDVERLAKESGQLEEYRVWQWIPISEADSSLAIWSYHSLYRFDNDETAESWVNQFQSWEGDETFTIINLDPVDLGDGGYAYSARFSEADTFARGVVFRMGELITRVELNGLEMPPEGTIEALAEAQLTCLEEEGCVEAIALPTGLDDFSVALAGAYGEAATDEDRESGERPGQDLTLLAPPRSTTPSRLHLPR